MRRHPIALVATLAFLFSLALSATVATAKIGGPGPVATSSTAACRGPAGGTGGDRGLALKPDGQWAPFVERGPVAGRSLEVLHGPVAITLTDEASDGHQVGDLRVTSIATTDAGGKPIGRLDATLTTTAVDVPEPGDEIRISTLVFSFGEDGTDQIIVGGSAVYPAQGPTLEVGTVTTRPIQGGSGRFAGVTGSAVSEHLDDGSWRHTLDLRRSLVALSTLTAPDRIPMARPDVHRLDAAHDDRGEVGLAHVGAILRSWVRHLEGRDDERGVTRGADRPDGGALERGRTSRSGWTTWPDDGCTSGRPAPERPRPAERGGPSGPVEPAAIIRDDLGRTQPVSAAGQELGLWHYTIPAGSVLEPHTHPGPQIARVIRGELEYTVISGEGTMIAADGTSTPIGPGTYLLRAGESVIENPGMEHFGANRGRGPVELIAATLYPEGAPLSIPVETPAPSTTPVAAASSAVAVASMEPSASPAG